MQKEEFIYLPLYSESNAGVLYVPEKSGLNNGRAAGRPRQINETSIRIPPWVPRVFKGFFPSPSVRFTILTSEVGVRISAKRCQDGHKSLMSRPNTDLLDQVIRSLGDKGRPYVMEDLYVAGFDSVKLTKLSDVPLTYRMELAPVDSFEEFQRIHDKGRKLKGRSKSSGRIYSQREVMRLTAMGVFFQNNGRDLGSKYPASRLVLRKEFERSAVVVEAALARAGGICELCEMSGPFKCLDGRPFLEVHHVVPLSEGGEDTLNNVAAICPNCHRACHFSPEKIYTEKLLMKRLIRTHC